MEWGNSSYGHNDSFGSNVTHSYNNHSFSNSISDRTSTSHHHHPVNVPAQLEIQRLSSETQVNEIRAIFGRYGRISRVVLDYRFDENRLHCWLDYLDPTSCEHAIRLENGRKVDQHQLVVQRCTNTASDELPVRKKPRSDTWGDSSSNNQSNGGSNWSTSDEWGSTDTSSRNDDGFSRSSGRSSRDTGRRGGSGSGSGSGSRGGRGCHKCGEEGHFARECPQNGGSGRGGGRGGRRGGSRRGGDRNDRSDRSDRSSGFSSAWADDNKTDSWGTDTWRSDHKSSSNTGSIDWGTSTTESVPATTSTTSGGDDWGHAISTDTTTSSANVDWGAILNDSTAKTDQSKQENADDDGWN